MAGLRNKEKFEEIKKMAESGMGSSDIAKIYGVTRQAISFTLKKYRVPIKKKTPIRNKGQISRDKKDSEYLIKYGIGYTEVQILRHIGATKAYIMQRANAQQRNIEWLFTLATWWDLWSESGKWELRGRCANQYLMGRKGDVGPYSPENVYIITCQDNIKEVRDRERDERKANDPNSY